MATSIQKLLKKKGWTGAELGKLLVASYLNDIKKAKGTAKRDLFTQAEFQTMADTLDSAYERQVLSVYNAILAGIENCYAASQTMKIGFNDSYNRYNLCLLEIAKTEAAKKKFENIPYVVTQAQYDRLAKEAVEKNKAFIDSYARIVFEVLEKCLEAFEAETEDTAAPKKVLAAIEATKSKAAKESRFYADYSETMFKKEWVLPSGERVSTDKQEAQRLFLKIKPQLRGYERVYADKKAELFFYGAEAIRAFLRELTGEEPPQTDEKLEDIVRSTVDSPYLEDSYLIALIAPCLGAELQLVAPPQDLTMYDMLPVYLEKMREADEGQEKKLMAALKKEMPELFTAVTDYIGEVIPSTKSIKPKEYSEDCFTWGEMAEAGLYGYGKLVSLDNENFQIAELFSKVHNEEDSAAQLQKRIRIATRGLAIAVNPPQRSIDKNGDFIDIPDLFEGFLSLEKLATDESDKENYRLRREDGIKLACRLLLAHNALMEIIESVYGIPELAEVTSCDIQELEDNIDLENKLIFNLYADAYGIAGEKVSKRKLIKEVFVPVNIKELQPKLEDIDSVRKEITDLGFTEKARQEMKNLSRYLYRLSNYKG